MKSRIAFGFAGFFTLVLSLAAQTTGSSRIGTQPPTTPAAISTENSARPSNTVSGSGTTNYIPVWTSGTQLGDSIIYQTGDRIGIRTTHPGSGLDVNGNINAANGYRIAGSEVLSLAGATTASNLAVGYSAFPSPKSDATLNTAVGAHAMGTTVLAGFDTAVGAFALYSDDGEGQNTATGAYALYANTGGDGDDGTLNTADGNFALTHNTTGSENTAVGTYALKANTTGSDLTCIGYDCTSGEDGLHNATAIGAHAVVSESNALVLGGTGPYAVKVGIGTQTPSDIFTIAQGAGHPISDGWETFSSRRWKTNIQQLQDALAKVEQLRGVSYEVKATGKHEVGVIAEEVGAVLPEVVSYEDNGKDARGVDYSRLTALLIEATKEQQALMRRQQQQIRAQQAQIAKLTTQVQQIQASLKTNGRTSEIRTLKAQAQTVQQ